MPGLLALLLTLAGPEPGLVAWYSGDSLVQGVVKDETGHGHDLKAIGEVTLEPGRVGQAVRVSAKGYLQAPAAPDLDLGGEMTLEAWIRPDFHRPSGMRLFDRATIGGNDGFMFDTWPDGHLRLIVAPGLLRDPDRLPEKVWTHVAATLSEEEGVARLYRNGQVVAEQFVGGKLSPSRHPFNLGASQGGGDRFEGLFDDVRIWRRALSEDEVRAHAEGRRVDPPAAALTAAGPSPLALRDGRPDVDLAAVVSHHDLVYLSPAVHPFEALRIGNGNLGVTLWNQGGLTWQLNNGNYRRGIEPVSSGRVTFSSPSLTAPPAGRFRQRLSLWDGTVTTTAGAAEVTSFVAEGQDALVVTVRDPVPGPREITLHLWPSRTAAEFEVADDHVALTEPAPHNEPLLATAMACRVAVDGARVTAGRRDARTLTLTVEPNAPAFTILVANPVLRGSTAAAQARAKEILDGLRAAGPAKLLAARQAYWHDFWPRSYLHLTSTNGEAELLANLWYLDLFDLASMSRHTLCPKFNGGNWLTLDDLRHWDGGYWHQNTREVVWPVYAAGHPELSDPFFELYARAAAVARKSGQVGLGVDGFYIPEWVGPMPGPLTGRKDFKRPGYTAFIFTVGLEVALQGWWRYEFTGDEAFLTSQVWPLLVGSLDFYLNYAKLGPDGKYHLEPADAQESYWLVKDPAQDLAALRWALPVAIATSRRLGLEPERRARWEELLAKLPPFAVDSAKDMLREADLKPDAERHNSENVAHYAIYPFGVFGLGRPDYQRAVNTFRNRPVPSMGNGWEPAAIVAARLGLGDDAAKLALAHVAANLRSPSGGWYSPTQAVFAGGGPDSPYYDAAGVCAQTLQEMLLQSHDEVIRVAPAWPGKWSAQFKLVARGGFEVTAAVAAGQVRYALVTSLRGHRCRLANPWRTAARVTSAGRTVVAGAGEVLEFDTTAGASYLLEQVAAPVAQMPAQRLAPAAAEGPRYLGRRLPKWPNWTNQTWLGIDAEGHTPQRAAMVRAVEGFQARLAVATKDLPPLPLQAAPGQAGLVDGQFGEVGGVVLANGGSAVLDLGASHDVSAMAFSRDRTGLRVDQAVHGFRVETSLDGTTWTLRRDSQTSGAPPEGWAERWPQPVALRYLRLTVWGPYGGPVKLDEVGVYGR